MNRNQQANSYKNSAIKTASPGQIILMLYDGALKFMQQAEDGFAMENLRERNETINNHLIKAQNVLAELQSSLDMKTGGKFSETMSNIYDFMIRQLQDANLNKNAAPIKIVRKLLKEIRDAWEEMLKKNSSEAAATAKANKEAATESGSSAAMDGDSKIGGGLNASA
jgi:flagellar protein FliS